MLVGRAVWKLASSSFKFHISHYHKIIDSSKKNRSSNSFKRLFLFCKWENTTWAALRICNQPLSAKCITRMIAYVRKKKKPGLFSQTTAKMFRPPKVSQNLSSSENNISINLHWLPFIVHMWFHSSIFTIFL